MGVEIYVNGKQIELKENTSLKFNYTIADIFSIGSVAVGYSNVFDVPYTSVNTLAMDGLGLIGSNSQVPYQKNYAVVKYDGFDIIPDGLMLIEESSQNYRMGIQDGMIDFFKDIENKSIGNDLDIAELKHDKNMDTVIESIEQNRLYRYVVANFGGKTALPSGVINIDYLIPVVKLSYFWNKIFNTFGYSYSGSIFSNPDFADAYITYPKAPGDEIIVTPFATARKNSFRDNNPVKNGSNYLFPASHSWTTRNPTNVFNPWNFVNNTNESQTFRIKVKAVGYVRTQSSAGPVFDTNVPFYFDLMRGTEVIRSIPSYIVNTGADGFSFDLPMAANEVLSFRIRHVMQIDIPIYLQISSIDISIEKTSLNTLDFAEAFSDYGIKDFVKEIIWRYGLTPTLNPRSRNIEFLTIDEKVNFSNYLNWSGKYIERTKEIYIYNQYGQSNVFQHKYNDEGDSYNNGTIIINNANLEPTKVVAASKIYSAEQRTLPIGNQNRKANIYPIWRGEINEGSNGIEVNYKGLNGRYYIMKLNRINETQTFKSEILGSNTQSTPFYFMPNENNTHYVDLVAKYYPTYQKILNNFKMHEIELALSLPDILQLDFRKLYYFEQEASFYILNKLQWEEGKTCKGEFIKIYR